MNRSGSVHVNHRAARRLIGVLVLTALVAVVSSGLFSLAMAAGPLAPPDGLSVFNRQEDQGLRVTLSWNTREGAAGYKVYRSTASGGPFEEVGSISAASMRDYPYFLDDTATPGGKYFYRVSSVDDHQAESPQSGSISAGLAKVRRISAPGKSILVSIGDQRAYFFENDVIVNILRVSTGTGGTPTGSYRISAHRGTVSGCNYWMDWRPNYGMHAWPSYLGAYEENLGITPRSHGCVRLHPLEAYWPYNWAPNGTPFTVIGGRYGGLPLQGGSTSPGATKLSKTWYFAEGYTDTNFLEYLLFFNPGPKEVIARTTYYPEGRDPVTENYFLAPGIRFTVTVNNVSNLPQNVGHGITINADAPIVVQQSEYFDWAGRRGGTATIGAPDLSTSWYFAEGYCGGNFSTFLLLFNPGSKSARCHVTYFVEGGAPYYHDFDLAPRTRGTTLVNALPGMLGKGVSIRVDSTRPLVAQRNIYFDWNGFVYGINGGDTAMGTRHPCKNWYLAEGCTAHFFDEYILVLNPTDKPANITIEFQTSNGLRGFTCSVAQYSRGTISVDSIPGMESVETSAVIASDQDIVVERSMYCSRDSRRGGDVSPAIETLSKDWYFAEGYTGGTFDEYVLVMNPHDSTATVNYLFHLENGADVGAQFQVGPKSRFTVHADDIPGVEWTGSAVEVHSDIPVVAEQSHYFCIPR